MPVSDPYLPGPFSGAGIFGGPNTWAANLIHTNPSLQVSGEKAMNSNNNGSDPTSGYNGYDPTGFDQAQWQYDQQLKLDEMERQFNSAEAQKNRDWQENLANTAYQRAVADIKKAGLNPWLALNGGSLSAAATPSGAQASASSGRSSVPNPTIFKAYLQLIGQMLSSVSSIFKFTGKF